MTAPTRRMLTSQEAADYCGFKSVNGFQAYVKVPPVNFGNNVRYDRNRLDEWLDQLGQSQPTKKRGFAERAGNEGGPRDRH
jgi:hypothetical protein